jgi:hypothetical protein
MQIIVTLVNNLCVSFYTKAAREKKVLYIDHFHISLESLRPPSRPTTTTTTTTTNKNNNNQLPEFLSSSLAVLFPRV